MSNKKSHRTRDQLLAEMANARQDKHKSMVHMLEDAVLSLEAAGESEQDIFSMVHMIMKGWIREGAVTEEYIQLARSIAEARAKNEEPSIVIATPGSGLL